MKNLRVHVSSEENIPLAFRGLTNRMWLSVVYSLIDNDTRHHSSQNVVDSRVAAEWVRNKFWPLWWSVSLSIRLYTTLNRIWFVSYHNIKETKSLSWQLKTPTRIWKCTRCIMQMSCLYTSDFSFKNFYYTPDSLWKIWLVERIQSIHNSLWTWHDKCNICCRYCIYHVKFNVCLVTKPLGVFSSETKWLNASLLFLRMNYVKNV